MRIRAKIIIFGLAFGLASSLGLRLCHAIGESMPGYVTYEVEDQLYIELVGENRLRTGDQGVIKFQGRDVATVKVSEVGPRYVLFQILTKSAGSPELTNGDSIVYESRIETQRTVAEPPPVPQLNKWTELDKLILGGQLDQETTAQVATPVVKPSTAVATVPAVESSTQTVQPPKPPPASGNVNLAPVLVPLSISAASKAGNSHDSNIFHGSLRSREIYQTVPDPATHALQSRLDTDGSIERLYASRWSTSWSGNLSYQDGNTGFSSPDYQHPQINIYNAMMVRRNDDGGTTKLGRFLPTDLPALGFMDGGQMDHLFSPEWRVGGALAFRPDRVTLDPSTKEPFMAGYASTERGTHGEYYYSGTAGAYHTIYKGKPDEMAVLYDSRMDVGPKLNLFCSSQIDFDVGAAQVHSGPQIIHLDLFGNTPVTPTVNFRTGVSHFQRPDIQAERDLSQGTTQGFDLGFWRYFLGANERLPFNFSLDEDLSYVHSATTPSDTLWRVTASRFGFFFMPRGQLSVSAYNITSTQGHGYGFQATASTPLNRDSLSMNISASSQYSRSLDSTYIFAVNDASARLDWRITRSWNADFGMTQSYTSNRVASTVADMTIGYRW